MNFLALKINLRLMSLIFILCGLGGCASFDKDEMTVLGFEASKTQPYSLSVSVGSGDESSDVGIIAVPRDDLQYAIKKSITEGHIFEKVVTGKNGDYLLNVSVFSLEQPVMGFTMTVKMEAGWTLRDSEGKVVWQVIKKSECSQGVGDAFVGAIRFRKANDCAIRNNIKQGMVELSSLNI